MENQNFNKSYDELHAPRHNKTVAFLQNHIGIHETILDLGVSNNISTKLQDYGYKLLNTPNNIDLDLNYEIIKKLDYTVLTAFQIFEHLVSPFPILNETKAKKLVASVPTSFWFTTAYWNENDPFDRHYHEFEPRQFDMLLNKAGWKIVAKEHWISKPKRITGVRSFLTSRTPRHYIVYCERN